MIATRQHLTAASKELFQRLPDERFTSLEHLLQHCQARRDSARDLWLPPQEIGVASNMSGRLSFQGGNACDNELFTMNDWSFGQLCRVAGVDKGTVNRLSSQTAVTVFQETLPRFSRKPLQLFTEGNTLRSLHGTSYTRVFDAEVVELVQEFAPSFGPPQTGMNGATGLYCGEQDLFLFLIDPTGWVEIEGEAFAPGFFLWNSEVGKRSLGIQTFWFQAVCRNHIVWDAVDVIDYSKKHTASVHEALNDIRRMIEGLVQRRDARKDSFVRCIQIAMQTRLGQELDDTTKELLKYGIPKSLVVQALEIAQERGRFTIFSIVDALTRIAGEYVYAGDRHELDLKAGQLLALAA